MRVSCPQCGTQYELPASQMRPGLRVKCRRCPKIFVAPAERAGDAPAGVRPPAPKPPAPPAKPPAPPAKPSAPVPPRPATSPLPPWQPAPPSGPAAPARPPVPAKVAPPVPAKAAPAPPVPAKAAPAPPVPARAAPAPPAEEEAPPPQPSAPGEGAPGRPQPGGVRALGMSTIRAQQHTPTATRVEAEDEDTAGPAEGWRVRSAAGDPPQTFRNLEAVRAWLGANPSDGIEISSDGRHWRPVQALLGMDPVLRTPSTGVGAPLGVEIARGPTPVVRISAPSQAGPREAGAAWVGLAILSTIGVLVSGGLAAQALRWVDLSDRLPLEALGLGALVPPPPEAPVPPEPPPPGPEQLYASAMTSARRARTEGRLIDAAVAWRRAIGHKETREALAGLAETYMALGDAGRAAEIQERIRKIPERNGNAAP